MTDKDPSEIADIGERLKRLELDHAAQRDRLTFLENLVHRRMGRSLSEVLRPQIWNFWQHAPRPLKLPPSYAATTAPANAPLIAIITPHFKQEHFLKATIESVLSQNYPNLAYCVQDAGSGEETRALLESYSGRLVWYSEADSGQAQAINRGFRHVSGDLMAYLNSDDLLLRGTLTYVAQAFQANPEIDLFYGHRIFIDARGLEIGRAVLPPHDPEALKWMDYVPQETLFWKRRVWDAIGPMDESFRFALDWDFIARAMQAGFRFKRLPRYLGCFRVHETQKTFAMMDVGNEEMDRVRELTLGRRPEQNEVKRAIRPYMRRQGLFHRLHKIGLLRY